MAKDFTETALVRAKEDARNCLNDNKTNLSVNSVAPGAGTYTITFGHGELSALKTRIKALDGAPDDFELQLHGHFKNNSTKNELAFIHIKCVTGGQPPEVYLASTAGTPDLDARYIKRIHDVAAATPSCGGASLWPLSDAYKRLEAERERRRQQREEQIKAREERDAKIEQEKLAEEARLREEKRKADDEKKKKGKPEKTEEELRYQQQRREQALSRSKK